MALQLSLRRGATAFRSSKGAVYRDQRSLARDLEAIGAPDCLPGPVDNLDIQLELVYGHCWGAGTVPARGEIRIDTGQIGRRNK